LNDGKSLLGSTVGDVLRFFAQIKPHSFAIAAVCQLPEVIFQRIGVVADGHFHMLAGFGVRIVIIEPAFGHLVEAVGSHAHVAIDAARLSVDHLIEVA
jgi:hypothetical protein